MNRFDHDYRELQTRFDLPPIKQRFHYLDCVFMYKVLAGIFECTDFND